jgi:hypothetical protein
MFGPHTQTKNGNKKEPDPKYSSSNKDLSVTTNLREHQDSTRTGIPRQHLAEPSRS